MDLLNYLRCSTTAQQNASIEAWVKQSPENEKELLDTAKLYYAQKGKWDTSAAYKKVQARIRRRKSLRRYAFASAFVLVAVFLNLAYWQFNPVGQDQYITLSSNSEKVVEYTLPDGSTVWLNRHSSLTFPVRYAKDERIVKLDGEGYFEVAKDENKPFLIKTGNGMDIKVLGTKFNLEAYASDTVARVSLLEGAVAAYFTKEELRTKYIRLFPGDELSFNSSSQQYKLNSGCANEATMWMQNTIVFNDTPLPEMLRRLSHEFDVSFVIADESLKLTRYSGTFDNRELSLVLDYMRITSGVKISAQSDNGKTQYIISN